MGPSVSRATVDNLREVLNKTILQTIQDCTIETKLKQSVDASNSGFRLFDTIEITQGTLVKLECFSDVKKEAMLQNKIVDTIVNQAKSTSVGMLGVGAVAISDATVKLTDRINNVIKLSNIQKQYISTLEEQEVNASNTGVDIGTSIKVVQGAQIFANVVMQEIDSAGIFNDLERNIDNSATSTITNPLDGLFGPLGMIALIMILVLIGGGMYMMHDSGSSK